MATIAVAVACTGGSWESRLLESLVGFPALRGLAVAAPPGTHLAAGTYQKRLAASHLRSAAAVIEVLRWFETTGASHLLWMLTSRAEFVPTGPQRLLASARDSKAAMTYSDYIERLVASVLWSA
jgi:hypothetical protein